MRCLRLSSCLLFLSHVVAKSAPLSSRLTSMCDGQAPVKGGQVKQLQWILAATGEGSLLLKTSPQHLAACWILYKDHKSRGRNKSKLIQRYALAVLHMATTQSNTKPWDWKHANDVRGAPAAQGHWMTQRHECSWYGIACDWQKRVVGVHLGFLALDGLLPRELGLLTHAKEIDVHGCDLQGVLPHKMLASLSNLEYLKLHMNGFFGALHREIKGLRKLKELALFGNYMAGTIPLALTELKNLEKIDLYANQLSGTIPAELSKLKKLRFLDLHDNNLIGSVPQAICDMKLDELIVDCLGPRPEVACTCCTKCCSGLPDLRCVDTKTGKEVSA